MARRNWGDFAPLWVGLILVGEIAALPFLRDRGSFERATVEAVTVAASTAGFDPWQDSVPEWASALTSLVALGVSIWAVFLVRGTLIAAQEANKGFKKSAERQLRAYLAFDGLDDDSLGGGQVLLKPAWKNAGQTPTRNAICGGWYALVDSELAADFDYPNDPNRSEGHFSLGPGCREEFSGPTITEAEAIAAGRNRHLYVWGWVEYNDVFEDTPRWRTEFCVRWIPRPGGARFTALHGPHNGTDSECLNKPST